MLFLLPHLQIYVQLHQSDNFNINRFTIHICQAIPKGRPITAVIIREVQRLLNCFVHFRVVFYIPKVNRVFIHQFLLIGQFHRKFDSDRMLQILNHRLNTKFFAYFACPYYNLYLLRTIFFLLR